jgi:TonB family protein
MKRTAFLALLLAVAPALLAQQLVVRVAVFEPVKGPAALSDHAAGWKWPTDLPSLWSAIGPTGIRLTAINRLSMAVGEERDTDRVHLKLLSAGAEQATVEVRVHGTPAPLSWTIRYNETAVISPADETNPETVAVSVFTEAGGASVPDILPAGGDVTAPVATRRVEPVYPEDQKAMRISGIVILQTVIDATGKVVDAHVLKNLPGTFGDAAIAAVKQWEFKPATLNGKPVTVTFNLVMQFKF